MNGIGVIVLSSVFFVGAAALLFQNQRRIRQRSLGARMMFAYALLFAMVGIAALVISMFDPTSNPTAQWCALGAYTLCFIAMFSGAFLMFRKQ